MGKRAAVNVPTDARSHRAGRNDPSRAIHYRDGCLDEAVQLVKRYHYSRRAPGNIQLVCTGHEDGGLFGDYGDANCALFLSIPPTRWSEPVWELSRLVRCEKRFNLTPLISFAAKRAKNKGADLLVSFADKTHDHHGGIYQAASWNYHGARERRMDGVIIGGKFYPGRTCNSRWGTQSPSKLSGILGQHVEPHYDEGKHLYWKPLTREGKRRADRLGLEKVAYPKPETICDVVPPSATTGRAYGPVPFREGTVKQEEDA